MNSDNNLEPSSTTDKPIMARGPADHPQLAQLPEWPTRTIAVLSTSDGGPLAIPVAAPVRAGDRPHPRFAGTHPGSLARLRAKPHVALAILTAGNCAFTALGRARH